MKRLQRSTVSHQIFIYSFKILLWENPITILRSRKHQSGAEMYCKLVDAAIYNTSLTPFWVLFPHFFEASCDKTFKCFLVLQGKMSHPDIWRVFCKGFCLTGTQNGTKTSGFSLFRLSDHLERSPRRTALLSMLNICPLTVWPLCLWFREGCGTSYRDREKWDVSPGRESLTPNSSRGCYSVVYVLWAIKAFKSHFSTNYNTLIQQTRSNTSLANFRKSDVTLPCSWPWKALSFQASCSTRIPHLYKFIRRGPLVSTQAPSPEAPLHQHLMQTCKLVSAACKCLFTCSRNRLGITCVPGPCSANKLDTQPWWQWQLSGLGLENSDSFWDPTKHASLHPGDEEGCFFS